MPHIKKGWAEELLKILVEAKSKRTIYSIIRYHCKNRKVDCYAYCRSKEEHMKVISGHNVDKVEVLWRNDHFHGQVHEK